MPIKALCYILSVTITSFGLFPVPCLESAVGQELYRYNSSRGVITFTTKPPKDKTYWKVSPRAPTYSTFIGRGGSVFNPSSVGQPSRSKYDALILQVAKIYQLEPALVKAVVHVESAFNPNATSPKGAMGLMQLMPDTARRFGVYNGYQPVQNVVGGVRYLRWLFERFNGNVIHVLAGYNAGENAVAQYAGIPPYEETRQYVKRVLKMRDMYRCDYNGQKKC